MRARILAFLAAVAMVVGALAVRSAMDAEEDSPTRDHDRVLVCARELGDLCDQLDGEVEVEAANTTADRLIGLAPGDEVDLGGWIVPGPWPEMVDQVRDFAGDPPIFDSVEVVGSSRLVVVVREGAIEDTCAADWQCVADFAIEAASAEPRRPGIGAPDFQASAVGVIGRAAALSARAGGSDYGAEVFGEHRSWLTALNSALDARDLGAHTLRQFLITPGSAAGFITTDAAARSDSVTDAVRPGPPVEVALSLGLREGAARPDGIEELARDHHWATPAAADSGLPSPDVLYALWKSL